MTTATLFVDEDMLDPTDPDVEWVSAPDPTKEHGQRVLATFDRGDWRTEAQVHVDGTWKVASRNRLSARPSGESAWTTVGQRRPVAATYGAFSGLPRWARLLGAPLYGLWFAVLCALGYDVNLQTLAEDDD